MKIMPFNSRNTALLARASPIAQDPRSEFGRARRPAALSALAAKGCVCVHRLKKETHVVTVGFVLFFFFFFNDAKGSSVSAG